MTTFDWLKAKTPRRPRQPVPQPFKRPGRWSPVPSGKRYASLSHAQQAARYLNTYGKQREVWQWKARELPDGTAQLWHRPRPA
jgi:hypothetical protein